MPVAGRMRRAAAGRWRPDPNGLFGGQQVIGHRAGFTAQGAVDNAINWNSNGSVRAVESEVPFTARADATGVRGMWLYDIHDQDPAVVGFTAGTPSVQMAMVQPDGATVQGLDLRTLAAPNTSLGNGVATPVTVPLRDGVFGVPGSDFPVARGDVTKIRIFADRGTDTTTVRFPKQGHQDLTNDPGSVGGSQGVTGPGTSHVMLSVAGWNAVGYGALGIIMPFALIGAPTDGPMVNVLGVGDSVLNHSLEAANQADWNAAFLKRAVTSLAIAGMRITATNIAQGNETMQGLIAKLQVSTNARRRLLAAGCWSHVFISHARNDIQNGRTAAQVIADFKTLIALVRSIVPPHTRVDMDTLPPYTDTSNNRLQAATMDTVLAWQLSAEAASLCDRVWDTGAVFASNFDRQRWPSVALGDPTNMIQDGVHPGTAVADVNGHGGHPAAAALLAASPSHWTI